MGKVKRVMLIDDDYVTNSINQTLIIRSNYADTVEIYQSPREALKLLTAFCSKDEVLSADCPRLILLDISMPAMDGFQFLDEFEKLPGSKQILVFLLTSSMHPTDMQQARKYNLAGYLNKPLNQEKISNIFSRVP